MTINKAIIIGHLGRDPETRYLPSGEAVTNFSIATTERWKDKTSGEAQERTEWHRITTFGRLAEVAGEYLKKGSHAYVEGKIQTRKYQDKDGVEKHVTEIRAYEIKFLSRPESSGAGGDESTQSKPRQDPKPAAAKPAPPAKAPSSKASFEDMPDDIPF